MSKVIIGIDPGAKGFLCACNPDNNTRAYISIADSTKAEIAHFLRDNAIAQDCVVVMEEVHAVFGSSAKGTFNFGEIFGFLQGLAVAYDIPYHLVPPKDWQKEIWINADRVYKSGKQIDTKQTSFNAALRLFPNIDFRKNERCKNLDDNKVDATLIAEYGRRRNL